MKTKLTGFIIVLFSVWFVSSSQASNLLENYKSQTIELSLNSAVLFALNKNPDIEIFWQRYEQSQHFTEEGKADFYPEINFNMSGGREFQDPSVGTTPSKSDVTNNVEFGITLEQVLFDGFSTINEMHRREKLSDAAFWKIQSTVEGTLDQTIESYFDIIRYQQEVKILNDLIKDIEGVLENVEDQFEEGAANKVVVDYASSRLSFAIGELNRANSSLNDAKSNLEFLTGKLPPKILAYYPEELNPEKLDLSFYLKSLDDSSSIVANDFEIDAMKEELKVAESNDFPEVTFAVNANQSHNNGGNIGRERELSATVRLNYTLFDGFKNKHAKNRVRSQIKELETRKDKIYQALERDLKLAYNQVLAVSDNLGVTESEILSNRNLKALNEENFLLGDTNIIELIESSERLNNSLLQRVELINDQYYNSYKVVITSNILDQNFFCESC